MPSESVEVDDRLAVRPSVVDVKPPAVGRTLVGGAVTWTGCDNVELTPLSSVTVSVTVLVPRGRIGVRTGRTGCRGPVTEVPGVGRRFRPDPTIPRRLRSTASWTAVAVNDATRGLIWRRHRQRVADLRSYCCCP